MDRWTETPQSSNIEAIGYDKSQHSLWIRFRSGGTYRYFDVPQLFYMEMMEAESIGKFFFEKIKGAFDFERREEEKDVLSNRTT